MSFLRLPRYARADCAARAAIAIYKPPDVRPILEAYSGKDIPIEYAKKEAEAKKKHIEEWQARHGLAKGGFTLSNLFGGSQKVRRKTPSFPRLDVLTHVHSF